MAINEDGTYDVSQNSRMFRALDSHEISAGNPSMEDSVTDYLTLGVADAVVSAGVGLYNTGVALGEVIGVTDKSDHLDEGDTINSLLGADAASFYGRHKTGIDATGMAIGALVPGLAGIRALRMLQASGKVSSGMQAATGLRNADIVMNSTAVQAAKKYALETTTAAPNWFSAPMIKAYAQGYKQQIMESLAFEAGVLATMNQNASLNPDDMGYFTSIGDQFWTASAFALGGGVLGGAIDSIRIAGVVRKFGSSEWDRAAPLGEVIRSPNFQQLPAGSKMLDLGRESARRAEVEKTIEPNDWFGRKQFMAGQDQLKSLMMETFAGMNGAGKSGLDVLQSMVSEAGAGQLESMATVLSGLKSVDNVSVKDMEDLAGFYAKTRTPSIIVNGENIGDIGTQLGEQQAEFMGVINRFTKDPEKKVQFDQLGFFSGIIEARGNNTSSAFANTSDSLRQASDEVFNVRAVAMKSGSIPTMIIPDFVALNGPNIAKSYDMNVMYAKAIGKEFDKTPDEFASYVLMHELGHVKNNSVKAQTLIRNTIYDIHKGVATNQSARVVEQLVTASVRSREANWTMAAGRGFAELPEKAKVAAIMKKLTSPGSKERFEYLGDPAELLADGAAYMTRKDTRELAAKNFPELGKMFDEDGAMAKTWNPTKAYYNARTKQVYSSYLPGVADVDQAAKVEIKGMHVDLHSPALKRNFALAPQLFQDEAIQAALKTKADYLDYDAQWVMADRMTYSDMATKDGTISIGHKNLPVMEKLAVLATKDINVQKAFDEGKVMMYSNSRKTTIQKLDITPIFKSGKLLDVAQTNASLPTIKSGMTRLFRAEGGKFNHADTFNESVDAGRKSDKGMTGDYYTDDLNYADYYRQSYGKDTKLIYIDVPTAYAQSRKSSIDYEFVIDANAQITFPGSASVVTREALPELVQQTKEDMRKLLASSKVKYNENEIARMLNIDIPNAMGDMSAPKDGWMLLGGKDYTKPEVYTFNYDHKGMADYEGAVMNMAGVSARNDAVKSLVDSTSAQLLGKLYTILPEMQNDLVKTVNPFASKAGLMNNTRTAMNSLREKAAYVGKLVSQHVTNVVHEIDQGYASHASTFNRADAGALRFELAQVDNILRREHYYHVATEAGNYVIRKDVMQGIATRTWGKFSPDMLEGFPDELIAGALGSGDEWAPDALKLGKEVSEFYKKHSGNNAKIVDRKIALGQTRGVSPMLDGNVLYAPPRDLTKQKYFGFVIPNDFKAGADSRRFMVYGESAAELEAKKLAVQQKYGTEYSVYTRADAKEFNDALAVSKETNTFDELDFDSTLFRKGTASELAPNVDLQTSATLDRYRTWTIRQEEALVRSGVELKYSGIVDQLKSMDKQYAKAETNTIDKRWQEQATIWKDTLSTMLNKRSRGTALEQEWVRVNDFLGEKGSQFMDNAMSGFRKFGNSTIDQATLVEYNAKLDAAGYKSPFDDIAQVLLSSPETQQSRLFPNTVKTFSKLISVTMLGLDQANSMLQLISTPIMALPVLMEAKQALKGTEAGARLKAATTVINPANGMAEPTSAKLLAKAATKFWSDEGKLFAQELKSRNIISDEIQRFHEVTDMAELNGRHTMKQVNDKIDKLAKYGSYWSGHNFAETYSRFSVAWAIKDICEIRGLGKDETWAMVSGAVDKVHGVYAGAQRPQLFQGVLGQSVGLYQTYFFNFAQAMLKNVADGSSKQTAVMAGMQGSIFGIQSFPGFQALNAKIGENNRKNEDLYTVTNADDPDSASQYAMYGLASHMFGTPIDFATRGSLAARNMLLIPTQFQDLPIVGTLSKAIANMIDTGSMVAEGDVSVTQALLHGMAHNGMNRPLQGVATIMMGNADTATGMNKQQNINRLGYDANADLNWAGMFARAIGTKPLNETILTNAYFRQAGYKANTQKEIAEIGGKIQLNAATGELTSQDFNSFARDYEMAGGEIQSFNAYWGRQLKQAGDGTMSKFQREMMAGNASEMGRATTRMSMKQTTDNPWDSDY